MEIAFITVGFILVVGGVVALQVFKRRPAEKKMSQPAYKDGQVTRMETPPLPQTLPMENLEALQSFYNPHQGVFFTGWKIVKAEKRAKLMSALNEEQRLVIQNAVMLQEAILRGRRQEAELALFIQANANVLESARMRLGLESEAFKEGFTLDSHQTLKVAKGQAEIELWKERELKKIENEAEERRAALAKEMARAKMMPELLQLEELHARLSETFKEIAKTQKMKNGFLKTSELERLQTKAEYFKQQIQKLSDRTPKQKESYRFDDDEDV